MARVSEVIRGWLGWCPNAPAIRTARQSLQHRRFLSVLHGLVAGAVDQDGSTAGSVWVLAACES